MARSQRVDSGDLYLFFKSLSDASLLIQQQMAISEKDMNAAFQLEDKSDVQKISLPVVKLAEECLAGCKDGLFEVFSGLALLRSLSNSEDHIDMFNEEGTEQLIKILCGHFKNSKIFLPGLLRYRASVLLFEILRYPKVAEKVLNAEINKLLQTESNRQLKADNESSTHQKAKNSRSRSRSKEKDKRRKDKKSKKEVSPSPKKASEYFPLTCRTQEHSNEAPQHGEATVGRG